MLGESKKSPADPGEQLVGFTLSMASDEQVKMCRRSSISGFIPVPQVERLDFKQTQVTC